MKRIMIIFTGISLISTILYTAWTFLQPHPPEVDQEKLLNAVINPSSLRYVALGDSYTIGEGLSPHQNWPNQLVDLLNQHQLPIQLVANPARTGWTTQDLIENELPVLNAAQAQAVTLQIGVNDWVQGVSEETFRSNIKLILNKIQQRIPAKKIIVITIPDFGITPSGKDYTGGRDASAGIKAFNSILQAEASAQGMSVVDIFELSQGMAKDSLLVNPDGLHPSAAEYRQWVAKIEPVAEQAFK